MPRGVRPWFDDQRFPAHAKVYVVWRNPAHPGFVGIVVVAEPRAFSKITEHFPGRTYRYDLGVRWRRALTVSQATAIYNAERHLHDAPPAQFWYLP